ncbi:Glycosyltransferase involved in cell wall bisynthesis [Paenibacillus tianmuensis]|uniref:Glycosyltransferase involved in cell wall bisynthesis n=1 Tax=Paenibacillus tianmuensis TaxID=624147 RepID=A0A1G4SVL2_9BACL|nr:glycosyltransferase family A protein [Paenibacillus tianmuensis]SCW72615.1 Glycosyltransferase involved in cell wall bisynthesis [Paenibacillus tianmuensis]
MRQQQAMLVDNPAVRGRQIRMQPPEENGQATVSAAPARKKRAHGGAAYRLGFRLGRKDAPLKPPDGGRGLRRLLNRGWSARVKERGLTGYPGGRYHEAAAGYVRGFFVGMNRPAPNWVPLPTERTVAVIVSAKNEGRTIAAVLKEASRLTDEIYVIVNGSVDNTFRKARAASRAIVLSYPQALGHDVGRSVGAKLAKADILLFTNGDMPIPAKKLVPFIHGIEKGLDVALNNVQPYLSRIDRQDSVTIMKQFLNTALGRPDLKACSLTAVPHALSRRAIETLGLELLSVPPKAHALAVLRKLRVGKAGQVNVIRGSKRRMLDRGRRSPVTSMIVGDHLEALKLAGDQLGERLVYPDVMRKRHYIGGDS